MHSIKNQGPFQGETKSALLKSNGHFCYGKLFDVVELGTKSVLGLEFVVNSFPFYFTAGLATTYW